jgi:hypothetical protein
VSLTSGRYLRAVAATATACALAACSGSVEELDVDGFSPGACTGLAGTLQEVNEALGEVSGEDITPQEASARFESAQQVLKMQREQSAEPVASAVTDLVTSLGFFRIAVDSNSYDASQVDDVRTELEAVAMTCRGA